MVDPIETIVAKAIANHEWRQEQTFNLIPSENTPSHLVRFLSILDPSGRYAEHKKDKSLGDVFYYQGTKFIAEVEEQVKQSFREFLGCSEVEVRPLSGNMSNEATFAALKWYFNRFRQGEPQVLGYVINNHLLRGGHLSSQPLGALGSFVRQDPTTGKVAVIHFPVRDDNPYKIDVQKTLELINHYRDSPLPVQLIVLGKSMVLHPEPVRELAEHVRGIDNRPFIMYDAAHVFGLLGPHFHAPFLEGADIVTGSTHKTFFGTQRGVIATNYARDSEHWPLVERISTEIFPGRTSNHHLGTLLGQLGACAEWEVYGEPYQRQLLANAKAFARALKNVGLSVEGDPSVGYTETHQVILNVGKGKGAEIAHRLEQNNIIVNSQALPYDASFSDASGIRTGVQEMTRFGMKEQDFGQLAELMADVILRGQDRAEAAATYRKQFTTMDYTFPPEVAVPYAIKLQDALISKSDLTKALDHIVKKK